MDKTTPVASRAAGRRASVATVLGCAVEAYDFTVYTYLIVYLAPTFFPSDDRTAATLASFLVFGAGFVARPLGGLFFGRLGDRIGRRRTLLVTIVLMGVSTIFMGLIPGYAQIGVAASVLLVIARLLQGFSAGGELAGAAVYSAEHASARNRGRFNAMQPLGFSVGAAIAPAMVALVAAVLPAGAMASWGWRVPLLLVLPLTLACLAYRLRVHESPQFTEIAAARQAAKTPAKEVLRRHPVAVVQVVALSLVNGLMAYLIIAYLPVYLNTVGHFAPGTVSLMFAIVATVTIPWILASGVLVDRFGRRPVLISSLVAVAVLIYPAMYVMGTVANAVVVTVAIVILLSLVQFVAPPAVATSTGLFPTRIRYTGVALGMTIGSVIGSGFGPYLAALLTSVTGSPYAPVLLVVFAAVLGVVIAIVAKPAEAPDAARPHGTLVPAEQLDNVE